MKLGYPIFTLTVFRNNIIISGGLGGKEYGAANSISVYDMNYKLLSSTPTAAVATSICFDDSAQYMCASLNENCGLFGYQNNTLTQLSLIKTDTSKEKDQCCAVFSPKAKYIACGCEDARIYLLTMSSNVLDIAKCLDLHKKPAKSIAFIKDYLMASVGRDNQIYLYNVINGTTNCMKCPIPNATELRSIGLCNSLIYVTGADTTNRKSYISCYQNSTKLIKIKSVSLDGIANKLRCADKYIIIGKSDGSMVAMNPSLSYINDFDSKKGIITAFDECKSDIIYASQDGSVSRIKITQNKAYMMANIIFYGLLMLALAYFASLGIKKFIK